MSDYNYRSNLQNTTSELTKEDYINVVAMLYNDTSQSSEDIKRAQQIVGPDSHVHFALRPIPEASSCCFLCCLISPFRREMIFVPCLWPLLVIMSICSFPCQMHKVMNAQVALQNTLYILTDTSIIIDSADHDYPLLVPTLSSCCFGSLKFPFNLKNLPLENISVETNAPQKPCCEGILFEEVPQVRILGLISLFVRNPDEVARQINEVKNKRTTSMISSFFPAQSAAAKRIFVSAHSNPTDFKIVMLNGSTTADWNRFLEEARGALGIPPVRASSVQVTLDQTTVVVQGASQLEAGDKVVLSY